MSLHFLAFSLLERVICVSVYTALSTVIQSYQTDGRLVMKGCYLLSISFSSFIGQQHNYA